MVLSFSIKYSSLLMKILELQVIQKAQDRYLFLEYFSIGNSDKRF